MRVYAFYLVDKRYSLAKAWHTRLMTTAEGSARESLKWRIWRWVKIAFAVFVILFVAAVFWRMPIVAERDRSTKVAQEIQDSHLILADVDGSHLPPAPDPKLADATVEGIDANQNGIRDDVELAIFKKYPGTANLKLRAAELQYAKALQFYLTSVFSSDTLVAAADQNDRGYSCIGKIFPAPAMDAPDAVWKIFDDKNKMLREEVENQIINTEDRKQRYSDVFEKYMTSHTLPNGEPCDVVVQ